MDKDLKHPVPDIVIKHQKPTVGLGTIVDIDGLLHEYYHDEDLFIVERLVNKMRAETGWFERITAHAPSVGSFYENLIYNAIQEVIPSDLKIGTGFVYDSNKREVSPQIDLLIYKDNTSSPLYKRGDFVIIDSANVVSCIEIKKTLTKRILLDLLSKFANVNLGTSPLSLRGVQFLNVFVFQSKLSLESVFKHIKDSFTAFVEAFQLETKGGEKGCFMLNHLVLPRIYFFDRTGYICCHCHPYDDSTVKVTLSLNRSSLAGHSLGEFLVSVIATKKNEQAISNKNFLTYPLVMPEFSEDIATGLLLQCKLSMEELQILFPEDIEFIRKKANRPRRPYGAYISSSIENLHLRKLAELEKTRSFSWLAHNMKTAP